MTQSATLRALDADIRSALSGAGLTDSAIYTNIGGSPTVCEVYVDRGVQLSGFDTQILTDQVTITALMAEILTRPKKGAIFALGAETFKVDQILNIDESRAVCLVVAN
jgi:hypothetical protein